MMPPRLKLAVIISGRGSNLQALIEATRQPNFPAQIALVISNEPKALGLERAVQAGLKAMVVDHRRSAGRQAFEEGLDAVLREAQPDLVCLAGFMRILSPWFVERWEGRLINIHPSLLPAFQGLDTHDRALAAGVRFHGCTVHYVNRNLDDGPIIAQAMVPVLPKDDGAALSARVLEAEHALYPLAVKIIAEKRVRLENGQCALQNVSQFGLPAYWLNPPG